MSTALLRLPYRVIHHKVFAVRAIHIPWKLVYGCVALASLGLLVYYIFIVNQLTQGAYLIKNYNKTLVALGSESGNLQANFAEIDFLGSVQEKAKGLSFQKTTKVLYVQLVGGSLAEAK